MLKWVLIGSACAIIIGSYGAFMYNKGYQVSRDNCLRAAAKQAKENIDVERKQNEIRANVPDNDAFLDILRGGQFGR
jgi:hypothetical protein